MSAAYAGLLEKFVAAGAEWVQFDEPYLVHDLTSEDIALFETLYQRILAKKGPGKVLLQTYFGDVRDCYGNITALAFDGIGLDFLEGRRTKELVEANGFPQDKVLFAGLVNGKNIWKNNYGKTLEVIDALKAKNINVVLNTSCSLLHVPYTLKNETKLPEKYTEHFAFAEEKLQELAELKKLADVDYKLDTAFLENTSLFATRPDCRNNAVQERVAAIREEDFTRLPVFNEREAIQKKEFALPVFPTTTIGSFPQTADVKKAWVQSYGTRCVKPLVIWGDVSREKPMTVDWSVYAQSLTKKPMKGMLTGPVTILNWSFPREDISLKESTYQIALAIRDEVLDLEANGIRVIQVDEAALREKLPLRRSDWYKEYLDWAIPAFRLVHSGVKAQTQIHTHMCYSEFTDIIRAIDDMDADVITFEASRSDLVILDSLKENHFKTEVGPGVYDIHSPRVPSVEEIKAALEKMLTRIAPEKLWVNPDCGLKTRGVPETVASLKHLVEAAKELRKEA